MIFINLFIRVFKPKKVVCSSEFKVEITLNFEKLTLCTPCFLLHFLAFFYVASLLSTGVDNEKVGVDNEKAVELNNRIIFSYFSLISI